MTVRRWPLRVALALGLALVAAPIALQMFTRGPGGAAMLADFKPYMNHQVLAQFQGYVNTVNAAELELKGSGPGLAASRLGLTSAQYDQQYAALLQFEKNWPGANANLTNLIGTIDANIGNYQSVAALPSFRLFPYFFVLPGLIIAFVAWRGLRRLRRGNTPGRAPLGLAILGVALIAAPLTFQMFDRAPAGERMLSAFRPIMTTERITTIQGYFLTIAGGEAAVRTQLLPALRQHGVDPAQMDQLVPKSLAFTGIWTTMSNKMAPMLAAMSNNLTRYDGLIALPKFSLFPYFFVAPGLILLVLAALSRRRSGDQLETSVASPTSALSPSLGKET